MALFSKHPPGVQIKRWFFILTSLVVVIALIAAISLTVVTNLMTSIVTRYEPLVVYSGDIAASVYQVNAGLYQYLGEYRQDTTELQKEVQMLQATIAEAFKLEAAADLGADLKAIDLTLEKYAKVLKMLPEIGTVTDWAEVDELKTQAMELGGQVERLAATMKSHYKDQIKRRAARSQWISSLAIYAFIGFLVLSAVIVVLLFQWWRDFQEMILTL